MTDQARPIGEQLSAHLDGELSPEEAVQVEELLRSDAEARLALEQLAAVSRLVAKAPAPVPPRDYRRLFPQASWWGRFFAWTPALASAVAVLLIAVGVIGALDLGGARTGVAEPEALLARATVVAEREEITLVQPSPAEGPPPAVAVKAAPPPEPTPEPEAGARTVAEVPVEAPVTPATAPPSDKPEELAGPGAAPPSDEASEAAPVPELPRPTAAAAVEAAAALPAELTPAGRPPVHRPGEPPDRVGAPPEEAVPEVAPAEGPLTAWPCFLGSGIAVLALAAGGLAWRLRRR